MNKLVHIAFCVCAALVAAEPGLEQGVPSLAPVFKAVLALCSAAMLALHYYDPGDASPAVKP